MAPAIKAALADAPVLCLLGPRKAGKTGLARKPLPDAEDTAGLQKFRAFGYPWPLAQSLTICSCSDLINSTTDLA